LRRRSGPRALKAVRGATGGSPAVGTYERGPRALQTRYEHKASRAVQGGIARRL
jgi:hypothetical protein